MAHTPPGSQQTPGTCMRQLGATTCSHNRGAMPAHNHIDRQTDQHNNMPQHRSCDQRSPHPDTHQGTDSTCNHADSSMNRSDATIQINNRTNQALHPQLPQQSTLATKPYAPTYSRQMQPPPQCRTQKQTQPQSIAQRSAQHGTQPTTYIPEYPPASLVQSQATSPAPPPAHQQPPNNAHSNATLGITPTHKPLSGPLEPSRNDPRLQQSQETRDLQTLISQRSNTSNQHRERHNEPTPTRDVTNQPIIDRIHTISPSSQLRGRDSSTHSDYNPPRSRRGSATSSTSIPPTVPPASYYRNRNTEHSSTQQGHNQSSHRSPSLLSAVSKNLNRRNSLIFYNRRASCGVVHSM